MKAPVCRLCGVAHWGNEHVWPKGTGPSQALSPAKPALERKHEIPTPGKTLSKAANDRAERRRGYMRDLMRKRRAAAKGAAT